MGKNDAAMTEEELKKKGEQLGNANQAEKVAPNAATGETPDPVEQSIAGLDNRVKELREYASSPVRIDKSGQTNWLSETERVRNMYKESPEQRAAREKRERTNRRIAALSDGLVALSNVAGAIAGANPINPSSTMSAAHRKAVEDAAKRRRENADRYETARRYYTGLQYKQDKDNADREAAERKARQAAGKQADTLDATAARLRQNKAKADAEQKNKDRDFEEKQRHNRATEGAQAERNAISASKGGRGSRDDAEIQEAYDFWERLTDDQKKQFRDWNQRGRRVQTGTEGTGRLATPVYGTRYMADDKNFILSAYRQWKGWKNNRGGSGKGSGGSSALRNRGKGSALKNRN